MCGPLRRYRHSRGRGEPSLSHRDVTAALGGEEPVTLQATRGADMPVEHAEAGPNSVRIVWRVDAPRETVWREWTESGRFARWFGTPPLTTPADRVSMDVRVGGRWGATM